MTMVESKSMDVAKETTKKRKRKVSSPVKSKSAKIETSESPNLVSHKAESPKKAFDGLSLDEIGVRFPVLNNEDLVKKFLAVTMTNNQKGRIRQVLKDNLKGTSDFLLPDVIHNRIQAVLKSSAQLTDTDLRKIRILYNMLKTALVAEANSKVKKVPEKTVSTDKKPEKEKPKKVKAIKAEKGNKDEIEKTVKKEDADKKEQLVKKVKGKKRYVVFLGNLPLQVNKEMIMNHFSELNEHILDIRIPKPSEEKKSAIAYVELRNEPTYELALSKHHSMMANKRINVLYTAQKSGKVTKAQAKSKSAKLLALQKSGKLIGSTPLNKKRSQRRMKMKQALAKQNAAT